MEFFQNNVLLIGLAFGSGVMLLMPLFKKGAGGVPNLSNAEAVTLINRQHALVLDVRDTAEFATGHLADAKNIPVGELEGRLAELKKYQNKPVLVHCQRGVRGAKACNILRAAEFKEIYHLKDGLDGWVEAKLPLVN